MNLDYGDDDKDFETLLGMKGTKTNLVAFCSGLKPNRSIWSVYLKKCNLFLADLFGNLAPFLEYTPVEGDANTILSVGFDLHLRQHAGLQ